MEYYTEETDNTTKNIVHEIVRECAALDLEINPNFCTYYVKLITLDPIWNISPEKKINRENIQTLVSFILKKMKLLHSPSLTTMKMQQHFLSHFLKKETMIENQRQILKASAEPLLENLASISCTDSNKFRIFKRAVLYMALMLDLGSPKNYLVLKETSTALKSIIDDTNDLYGFGKMKPDEKVNYIEYLQSIVFGIRLFNRDSGRNIAEIDDMPKLISQALVALGADLQAELQQTKKNTQLTTSVVLNMFYLSSLCKTEKAGTHSILVQLSPKNIKGITEEDTNHVMEMLVLYLQYEIYIRLLIARLQEIEISTKKLVDELADVVQKLRSTIKYNIGVATNIIFPLMIELGCVWRKFQDEFIVIALCTQIFAKLREFLLNEYIDNEKFCRMMITENKSELSTAETRKIISSPGFICEFLEPTDIIDPVHFEFSGFCIWTFTQTRGGLIPGEPRMGILKWKNKYYCFAHPEATYIFGKDPEKLILKAYSIIRKRPEVIAVLKLHKELFNCRHLSILDDDESDEVSRKDLNKMYQTDLHPIRRKIDPNYVWNVWDHYRNACNLATITGYQTHSVQTKKSNFRYSVPVQTMQLREAHSLTKKQNYMNVATPSNFLFGLRGRVDDNQHIVDLTRPVNEERYRSCATAMNFPPPCQPVFTPCKKSTKKKVKKFSYPILKTDHNSPSGSIQGELTGYDYLSLSSCMCVKEIKSNDK